MAFKTKNQKLITKEINEDKLRELNQEVEMSNQIIKNIEDFEDIFANEDNLKLPLAKANEQMANALAKFTEKFDSIKVESSGTIKCIANLYLDKNTMKNKNIKSIINEDANILCDLKYNIEIAKNGLNQCMIQIESGVNDPEMHKAVSQYQKEIRDSIKMYYDIQKKMKDFYKNFKDEIPNINSGNDENNNNNDGENNEAEKPIIVEESNVKIVNVDELMKNLEKFSDSKKEEAKKTM